MLAVIVLAAAAQLPSGGAPEAGTAASLDPTVFRNLRRGELLPPLEVTDLEGRRATLQPEGSGAAVIAFLRHDQEDSRAVLGDLAALVLDQDAPPARVIAIGMRATDPAEWREPSKGLPRRVQVRLDAGAAAAVGLIVVPSLAVVDESFRLRGCHVLRDPQLPAALRRDLEAIAGRAPAESTAAGLLLEELAANAAALEAAGHLAEAVPLRLQQVALDERAALAHAALGRLRLRLGQPAEAVAHLRRSLELEPTPATRARLGQALLKAGQVEEAKQHLEAALELSPDRALVHRELAEIAKARGDLHGAIEHVKAAIAALRRHPAGGENARR